MSEIYKKKIRIYLRQKGFEYVFFGKTVIVNKKNSKKTKSLKARSNKELLIKVMEVIK